MRIVIIGGHLSPALAVIEELPKETEVLFIGRKYVFEGDKTLSLEYRTITEQKIPFANIFTGRLQRKFTRYTIFSLLKIPYGFIQAFFILRFFKPDVILGFGGYLSLPVILSAFILKIPVVIHEQTLEAGLSNKIAAFFAKKICTSWESSRKFFPKNKTVLTGNPVRKFKIQSAKFKVYEDQKLPIIYVTGGSSGSHFINTLIQHCIKELLCQFIIIHQTGDSQQYKDFDRQQKLREDLSSLLKSRYVLKKFIAPTDIGLVLQKATLVISRSGINTITELIYFEKPAILIPIAFGQNNEQLKNALFFESLGLGVVLDQESLDSYKFLQKVIEMVNNINKYKIRDHFEPFVKRHSGNQVSSEHLESPAKSDSGQARMTSFENAAQKIIKIIKYVKESKKD